MARGGHVGGAEGGKGIVVTGGSGKLGRAVVQELVGHGHAVINVDRAAPASAADVGRFVKADLTDFGQVVEVLTGIDDRYAGVDAVVHLAAVPGAGFTGNAVTFTNNVTATHNVFQAARVVGIKRVVWASSETLLGLSFSPENPPPYLPVDEEYAARPESSYALAKHLEEAMAAQFCRWDPQLTMVGLRFSNVMEPDDYVRFPSWQADPTVRRWNAWGYIDARDGAQAVRLALAYEHLGMEIFIISNSDTVMTQSSASLAEQYLPGVPVTRALGENETLLSIDKARRLLGYEPSHTWRTVA